MKKILLITLCFLPFASIYAQDTILKKNGERIEAKVMEITTTEVKYKKYTNLNGPMYTIGKLEISIITYEDGSRDIFDNSYKPASPVTPPTPPPSSTPPPYQAREPVHTPQYSTPPIQKKPVVRFGLKAGLGIANLHDDFYENNTEREIYSQLGFTGGFVLDFRVMKYFAIQPEFLISMKGCTVEGYTVLISTSDGHTMYDHAFEERSMNFTYLEVPVNLLFTLPIRNDKIYLGGGPYVAYGVYGKNKSTFTNQGINIDDEIIDSSKEYNLFSGEQKEYNPFDWGLNFIAGYEFGMGIFINAGYSLGLSNISSYNDISAKNSYIHFSVGIKF